jgi:hypothetical protein
MFVSRSEAAERLVPAVSAADHLLFGVSDLDFGIDWIEKRTGVTAAVGGSHPGVGTRNALLSLGGRRYLEIIAPDPAQKEFTFRIDVRRLSEPRLVTWAAGSRNVDALSKKALEAGFEIFGPQPGSRARPDGKVLRWKTFGVMNKLGGDDVEPVPFFIEWAADSVHPSQDSPKGCELLSLEIAHPRPAEVHDVLGKLGIEVKATKRDRGLLVATVRTPKGTLKLT